MTQKLQVSYTCDIDGEDIPEGHAHRRTFRLDGKAYEIDLCDKHNRKFDKGLAEFVGHAHKAGTPRRKIFETVVEARRPTTGAGPADTRPATASTRPARPRRTTRTQARSGEIRDWAKAHRKKIKERGRIPASIVAEYEAAH